MQELQSDDLKTFLENNQKAIVLYGAAWCGVCRVIKPKFVGLANERTDIAFIYVDAEKYPGARQFAEVTNLPTFAGFVDGKLVLQKMGSKEEAIMEVVNEVTGN